MALAKFNIALTYSAHVIELWNVDGNGEPTPFAANTVLSIARKDDLSRSITVLPATGSNLAEGYLIFNVDLGSVSAKGLLKEPTDSVFDYDVESYDHVYSVKSPTNTYMYGKVNLLEVA